MSDPSNLTPINALSAELGLTARTLRYWEYMELITAVRSVNARDDRHYTPDQVARVRRVQELRDLGFSIEKTRGFLAAEELGLHDVIDRLIDERQAENDQEIRDRVDIDGGLRGERLALDDRRRTADKGGEAAA